MTLKSTENLSFFYEHQSLCYDWKCRLESELNAHTPVDAVKKLCEFQSSNGLERTGFVDAQTRLCLIKTFPTLAIQLTGNHLEKRCLFSDSQTESALFDAFEDILYSRHSFVSKLDNTAQLLAIRGVQHTSAGWCQTESAKQFRKQPYGHRSHFSADKPDYSDSVMAVLWRMDGQKHVHLFACNVNPCAIWPNGTAHLNHGQYFYRIGRHRTRERAHINAVLEMSANWPNTWIFDQTEDSIQYLALEGTSDIEVIRSHGESLDISDDDIQKAESAIAHREPTYVDAQRIKINIHTCALDRASSLGCQNIMPWDYSAFMRHLLDISEYQKQKYGFSLEIPYTLMDASMIA